MMDGDWICSECNEHNFARRWTCFRCNATKDLTTTTNTNTNNTNTTATNNSNINTTTTNNNHFPERKPEFPSDWKCSSCNANNFARREICFVCGAPKHAISTDPGFAGTNLFPVIAQPFSPQQQFYNISPYSQPIAQVGSQMLKGDWLCTACKEHNFARRKTCFGCGAARLSSYNNTPLSSQFQDGDWVCKRCNEHNFARRSNCFGCGSSKEGYPADWLCPSCGENNFARRVFCFNCQAPKPAQPQPPPVQPIRPVQMTGDWICPKCNEHNFARRYVCFNCQEAKPENATTIPPPELPWLNTQNIQTSTQVMAGDWFCSQCSAHNFARRMTCYSCGATKEPSVQ
jgi:hypothetical protein